MRRGVGLLLALVIGGCSSAVGPVDPAGTEIELAYGQTVRVDDSALRVSFTEVLGDSRCPVDVTCFWAGNARIRVGIASGLGPSTPLELNSTVEPRSAAHDGVRITLLEVAPEPLSTVDLEPEDYSIRLRVESAGS